MTTIREASGGRQRPAAAGGWRSTVRMIVAVVLAVLLTLFAVLNSQSIRVHLIFTTTHLPMIVVIAACGVIGIAVGWLIGRRRAARGAWP